MITVIVGKEIEKIKGNFESYLNGLNMVGKISYSQYSELYDEGTKQIQKAYELGKAELEEEKCELLGIIQGKDKVIQELKKENAELTCQMKRNTFCYSCKNATERCYRNEIGCPCEKYKSYKDENAELKDKLEVLIAVGNTCTKGLNKQLTKAKKIIRNCLNLWNNVMTEETVRALIKEAEQFIREEENDRNRKKSD